MLTKRLFDLICAISALLLLAPLLLLLVLAIRLDSRGPALFRQTRIGQYGRPFQIMKFRTMFIDSHGPCLTIGSRDPRITRLGYWLRRYKLDEFPQLLNVLRGEMSLVGPRPEVPQLVKHYPAELRDSVLSVPAGITDFSSIAFFNENDLLATSEQPETFYLTTILPAKLALHQRYVRERSLWLDCRLVLHTLLRLFVR